MGLLRDGGLSLRTRFLFVVLGAALIPLAVLGLWLIRGTRDSGERLLGSRLEEALAEVATVVGSRWVQERSAILAIAEGGLVRRALLDSPGVAPTGRAGAWRGPVLRIILRDREGNPLGLILPGEDSASPRLAPVADAGRGGDEVPEAVAVSLPVFLPGRAEPIGSVEAWLAAGSLVPANVVGVAGAGVVIAALARGTGTSLLPVPFDPAVLGQDRFTWGGEEWMTARRTLEDPPFVLVAAGQLGPFTAQFRRAARTGVWALLGMTGAAFTLILVLTGRLTRSLEQLATAADAVSRGDLGRQVDSRDGGEVGRVAEAFNLMTESLQRTLRELSERRALAAVGEFASTLAHEVRNPLGAMRLTLQSLEERMGHDPHSRERVRQALGDVERLEGTVAGALQVSRSGRVRLERIDVRKPIELAMAGALPEFTRRGAVLDPVEGPREGTEVLGDGAALERLFLNLLLNAAQALEPGGHAGVRVVADPVAVAVSVWDEGPGIPAEARERVLEPFYSSKPEGTGLGLAIAKQIVAAHRGELRIEGEVPRGTRVRVVLVPAA